MEFAQGNRVFSARFEIATWSLVECFCVQGDGCADWRSRAYEICKAFGRNESVAQVEVKLAQTEKGSGFE